MLEVARKVLDLRNSLIVSIVTLFGCVVAVQINTWAGIAGTAVGFTMYAFTLKKVSREMKYLSEKYDIDFKSIKKVGVKDDRK